MLFIKKIDFHSVVRIRDTPKFNPWGLQGGLHEPNSEEDNNNPRNVRNILAFSQVWCSEDYNSNLVRYFMELKVD